MFQPESNNAVRATTKATPTTMTARTEVHNLTVLIRTADEKIKTTIALSPGDTVGDVKFAVQKHKGLPIEKQALILGDRPLEDRDLVSDYGLKENQVVSLSTSMILNLFIRLKF